ncbi:MAG: PilW family protein [Pseudomonadota bacterium]
MKRAGFTLVEMLVAMTIAAVVLAMAAGVYRRQEHSYQLQNEIMERQQNGRIALDAIMHDLRQAGHITCLQTSATIDYDGDGNFENILNAQDSFGSPPAGGGGTDAVTIVYGRLPHLLASGPPTMEFTSSATQSVVLGSLDLDADGANDFGLAAPGIPAMPFGVAYDFVHSVAFTITGGGTTLTTAGPMEDFPSGTYVSPVSAIRYWVDDTNTEGAVDALDPIRPRLVRQNFGCDLGEETVAEGVTNLQIQYGVDTNNDGAIDAFVDSFAPVTTATERDVIAVQVWILVRNATPRPLPVTSLVNPAGSLTMGNVTVSTAPNVFPQQVLFGQVKLRNRR